MKIETRRRSVQKRPEDLRLTHHDILFIAETEDDSTLLDLLGQPGSTVKGEIRLADGYGEHYLMIQPKHMVLEHNDFRDFEDEK